MKKVVLVLISIGSLLMLFLAMTQIANGAGREASMGGGGPYIQLLPNCADTSPASITVIGGNWPTNETVDLFWFIPPSTYQYLTSINAPHAGSFSINMSRPVVSGTTYLVRASSASVALGTVEASFTGPCGGGNDYGYGAYRYLCQPLHRRPC
jgi:hypothetical protein